MKLGKLIEFQVKGDERGSLVAIENNKNIPFEIKRIYYIFDTKHNVTRGKHAHKNLSQVLICLKGSCCIFLDNGSLQEKFILDTSTIGLLIENLIWREMHDFSEDCVLLVLASEHYDESDYIRDYNEFLRSI